MLTSISHLRPLGRIFDETLIINMEVYSEDDIKFKHPFSMMIAGPRRSGKTEFTRKLILNSETLIDEKIDRFVWFYSSTQDE